MAASFGEWLKEMAPVKAALGAVILIALSFFSFGAAANHYLATVSGVPGRVTSLEIEAHERDSISGEWRAGAEGVMQEMRMEIGIYFANDSIYKAETNCLIRRLIEGLTVDRYDCKPETGESQ